MINLSVSETINQRKEAVNYKYKRTFNSWIILNGFGGHWKDHEY